MDNTDGFWNSQRLSEVRNGWLLGRNSKDIEPDGFIGRQLSGVADPESIRVAVAAAVACLIGYGVGPRWSGLNQLGSCERVAIDRDVRAVMAREDYGLLDQLWLHRDQDLSVDDLRELLLDVPSWRRRKCEDERLDAVDAAGCLTLRSDRVAGVEKAARGMVYRDEQQLLSVAPRNTDRAGWSRRYARLILAMRLLEVNPALGWDEVRTQVLRLAPARREAWARVAAAWGWTGAKMSGDSAERKARTVWARMESEGLTLSETLSENPVRHSDRVCSVGPGNTGSLMFLRNRNGEPIPNSTLIAGVDPGLDGAIVMLKGDALKVWKMPIDEESKGLDAGAIRAIVDELKQAGADVIYVEQTQGWGLDPRSAYTLGLLSGQVSLALELGGLKVERLTPREWQAITKAPTLERETDKQIARNHRAGELLIGKTGSKDLRRFGLGRLGAGATDALLIAIGGSIKAGVWDELKMDSTSTSTEAA